MSGKDKWVEGGVYLIDNGKDPYKAAKILKLEDRTVHVCYYGPWNTRPTPEQILTLTAKDVVAGPSPMSRYDFVNLKPSFITLHV